MSDSSQNLEGDLVPDPKHDPLPWTMYGLGAVGLAVLIVGWWAGSHTTGVLRLVCRVVAVLGGAYGVYMIGLSAGWQVFSRRLDRWMNRARLRSAGQDREALVELRFGQNGDERPPFLDALYDAANAELSGAGNCGEIQISGGGAVTYYFHGRDLNRLVAAIREVAAQFPLPQDAYLWLPSQARAGFGTVLRIR